MSECLMSSHMAACSPPMRTTISRTTLALIASFHPWDEAVEAGMEIYQHAYGDKLQGLYVRG